MVNNYQRLKQLKKASKIRDEDEMMKFDEKERAIIDVGAENYDDIFSPFCLYDMNVLDFELEDYLDSKSESIPLEHDLNLVFHITDASEEKRKEIESTVKQNYESRLYTINNKVESNKWFSILMLFSGLIVLGLVLTMQALKVHIFIVSMIDIFSWALVWTAVDSFFLDRKELQIEKISVLRLINAKVIVKDFIPKTKISVSKSFEDAKSISA